MGYYPRFFHVSKHDLGDRVTLEAKLPSLCNLEKEGDIPRICVSPLVHHCLRAVSSGVNSFKLSDAFDHAKLDTIHGESLQDYIERVPYIRGQSVYCTVERPFVPPAVVDFRKNKEHWFLKDTEFKRIGYIDLEHLYKNRKVRVINEISEVSSVVLLTIADNTKITYTPNSIEYFSDKKISKGTKCQNRSLNTQTTSSALLHA